MEERAALEPRLVLPSSPMHCNVKNRDTSSPRCICNSQLLRVVENEIRNKIWGCVPPDQKLFSLVVKPLDSLSQVIESLLDNIKVPNPCCLLEVVGPSVPA